MMDAKAYRRALAQLGLTVSGKLTTELLDLKDRTSREYARLDGEGAYPVPRTVELALRLMVKHNENPEWWAATLAEPVKKRRQTPAE